MNYFNIKKLGSICSIKVFVFLLILSSLIISNGTWCQTVRNVVPGAAASLLISQKKKYNTLSSTLAIGNGLQQIYSSTGKYTLSADGIGSLGSTMNVRVNKPNVQATVQKAILISSATYVSIANSCVTIGGSPISWNSSASASLSNGITFNNYWADVTSLVASQINSFPAGLSNLSITECNTNGIEGEALLVVFNDAAATEKTIIIMWGIQNPTGDNFSVSLAQPINPNETGALLDMGLGIGFSYQLNATQQSSQVSVNGQRLTSAAGGEDDGVSSNGALITVGGIGDVNTNPTNPLATPTNARSDDELYSILPFITNTTTSLNINTINPSNDDNIFLAYFALSGAAIIGEGILLSQTSSSGNVGTIHTVKAIVKNTNGLPVSNRTVTFTITSGPNAGGTFTTTTDVNGEAFYTYNGSGGTGTDNIQACFTNSQTQVSCSNTLSFEWIANSCLNCYYSKATGDLHNVLTWGVNPDGSGANPPDFGAGKTFNLANRTSIFPTPTYVMTGDWAVEGTINMLDCFRSLSINGFTLTINHLTGLGCSASSILLGSSSSNLVITGNSAGQEDFVFASNALSTYRLSLNNFTINRSGSAASVRLRNPVEVFGVLTVNNGNLTTGIPIISTLPGITLKSTATNTARVAQIPSTASITGNVIVERYIPARRAWRLLAAPVGGAQSINAAWQEGATTFSSNPNPNPDFGTHVTQSASSGADGLDFNTAIAMSSLKMYQNTTNAWMPVLNTNTTPVNSNAWFTFVRGDRSINMGYNTVAPNNTTLRSVGPLKTGDQTFAIATTGLTTIANPYASPINFASIAASNPNISNSFTVVDPKLGSTGAFVTVSYNTVTSTYDVTPAAASPINQLIQSGQGFLVQSNGAGGNVVIKETDKSATAAADVFRVVSSNNSKGLRINLQALEDNNEVVLDEAFSSYDEAYSNKVDNLDAIKAVNQEENLAIVTDGKDLIVERRKMVDVNDVVQLKLWNTSERNYILDFNPINLSSANIPAHIEDSYLKTSTPIDLTRETKIPFVVTSDAASKDPNRFKVVFSKIPESVLTLGKGAIKVVPNPVSGGIVSVVLENQPIGKYNVELIDNSGRTVYKSNITHQQNSATYPLKLNSTVVKGLYKLRVIQGEVVKTIQVLIN